MAADVEYGLAGLSKLPLMEQVHRVNHAIKMKYPFKQTQTWKSLSSRQKMKMLQCLREMKQKGKKVMMVSLSDRKIYYQCFTCPKVRS